MRPLFLFLFFPISLFAVTCTILEDTGDHEVIIHCSGGDVDSPVSNVLTKADCEALKQDVSSVLSEAYTLLRSSASSVDDLKSDVTVIQQDVTSIQYENSQIIPYGEHSTNIYIVAGQASQRLSSLYNSLVGTAADLYSKADEIDMLRAEVNAYTCSNESCSGVSGGGSGGGGSVSCPCQEEFNEILSRMSDLKSVVDDIYLLVASNNLIVASLAFQVDLISDCLISITNRLDRPDDRMWGELEDIYLSMQSNLQSVVYSSLNFQQIFYSLRSLIRGDNVNQPRLNLTSEGVISLVDSVLSMARNSQDQYSISAFDNAVKYFSNTVSRYYQQFNFTALNLTYTTPWAQKSHFLYNAFTNTSLNAANRFYQLFRSTTGSVTNWWQRMELYQQAQLGWFDTPIPSTDFEENQASITESGLTYGLDETTNQLSSVVNSASNLAQRVNESFSRLTVLTSGISINASLPTQLTVLPLITIAGESFGPVYFDTSPWSSILDSIRSCTGFLWKVSFYVLILAAVYFVSKWAYGLVLYIIHIMQNL